MVIKQTLFFSLSSRDLLDFLWLVALVKRKKRVQSALTFLLIVELAYRNPHQGGVHQKFLLCKLAIE